MAVASRVGWLALLGALGCAEEAAEYPLPNPERVTDISGATFGWGCVAGEGCGAHYIDESPPALECAEGQRPALGYTMGGTRFFPLYETCVFASGSWGINDYRSRYLSCFSTSDCPQLAFTDETLRWECVHGLCQRAEVDRFPRDVLNSKEALLLCFNQIPRDYSGDGTIYETIAERVVEYCPEPGPACAAPPECAQP